MRYNLFYFLIDQKANLGNYIKKPSVNRDVTQTANRRSEKLGNVKKISSPEAVINPLHICVMIQFVVT